MQYKLMYNIDLFTTQSETLIFGTHGKLYILHYCRVYRTIAKSGLLRTLIFSISLESCMLLTLLHLEERGLCLPSTFFSFRH